ncbi:SMP-30/gluconolactonase/LRE family protein [Streptomyces sp. NPDC050804]|uniref:SMP-30/gluconolactonase/LRE family protein n=1 Tax=Streptomyces sp. NPDC050804 TaxID=3154745 RepID=UPI003439C1A0
MSGTGAHGTGAHGTRAEVLWPDRLELGEGIRWVDGRIVLVDILSGRLLAAPPGDRAGQGLAELTRLPVALGAVAPVEGRPGSWIAAAGPGICLLDTAGGPGPGADDGTGAGADDGAGTGADAGIRWLARPEDGAPVRMRMNDATADPHGRFWAGSMAYDDIEGAGSLYRVDRDGTVTRVLSGITVPNGPAFSGDGETLFLADSARGLIRRYPVDPVTGELGEPSVFTTLDTGGPDGMAVDAEGGLWTAVWGEGVVHRYRPDGALDQVVRVPAAQPAGVCLGGEDGRTLFVTSARTGLSRPVPFDGAVFAVRVEVPGLPTASYRPDPGNGSPDPGSGS